MDELLISNYDSGGIVGRATIDLVERVGIYESIEDIVVKSDSVIDPN